MKTPICVDCRTVLRGGSTCDRRHRVVDLAAPGGSDLLLREIEPHTVTGTVRAAPSDEWRPEGLSFGRNAAVLAIAAALLVACCVYAERRQFGVAIALFSGGVLAAGIAVIAGESSSGGPRASRWLLSSRREQRGLPARAEPPLSSAPDKLQGVIASTKPTRSPFSGEECAGWALEVSLANAGVMLRDGETSGMSVRLSDGRTLVVPAGILRLARGASSDRLDSDAVARHVRALGLESIVVWDEARAIELHVGSRVELAVTTAETAETEAGYREAAATTLTAVDVPTIRRA